MFMILVAGGLATLITVLSPSTAPAALLNLGPEQIVLAGGEDLIVPGYSVPCFMDFDSDGLKDLLVGEGGSGFDGKIRVYLNRGIATTPQFSDFGYVQSNGLHLDLPGGPFHRISHCGSIPSSTEPLRSWYGNTRENRGVRLIFRTARVGR